MIRFPSPLMFALSVQALGAGNLAAEEVTIGASMDNTIYAEDGDKSNGQGEHVFAWTRQIRPSTAPSS